MILSDPKIILTDMSRGCLQKTAPAHVVRPHGRGSNTSHISGRMPKKEYCAFKLWDDLHKIRDDMC